MARKHADRVAFEWGYVGGGLFAVPFAAAGLLMAMHLFRTLVEFESIRNWVRTPATITRAELATFHDETTSYRAKAEYDYEFAGQTYRGNRVSIDNFADNIGDFQQRAYQELEAHRSSGTPFPCLVNPNRPTDSILYSELRWEIIVFDDQFVLAFGGFGGAGLLGCIIGAYRSRQRVALSIANPDSPWLWRADWAANEITDSNRNTLTVLVTAIAVFWNIAVIPVWWVLPPQVLKGNAWALPSSAILLIGLGLGVVAVCLHRNRKKHGLWAFRFKSPGPVIGGMFEGVIESTRSVQFERIDVALVCHRRFKFADENVKQIWHQEQQGKADNVFNETGELGTIIPIRFEIPGHCQPTSESQSDDVTWSLTATFKDPGRPFKVDFTVPVF